MVFYFSGTGNSLYAAKKTALHNGQELAMKAVQYGKSTVEKGRYTNPNVNISERVNL